MSDITKKQFALRLPEELLAQVDARAKAKGLSRNQWFERMTRHATGDAPVNENKAMAHDGYTEPVRVTPARKIRVEPIKPEQEECDHIWEKVGTGIFKHCSKCDRTEKR